MTSRSHRRADRDWAYLDSKFEEVRQLRHAECALTQRYADILLGRTLHVHALSPLHLPDEGDDGENHTRETEEDADNSQRRLTSEDLDRFTQHLITFLRIRMTGVVVDPVSRTASNRSRNHMTTGESSIRHVRASFVSVPHPDDDEDVERNLHDVPPSWAVEIEVRLPATTSTQTDSLGNPTPGQNRQKSEYAHLLFLSSPAHVTPTHYPFLVWKAPPASAFPRTTEQSSFVPEADESSAVRAVREPEGSASGPPPLNARLLIGHALDFVSRYFDCRQSQQAPLSSIRGLKLASIAEAVFQQHRSDILSNDEHLLRAEQCAVDVGYALPASLTNESMRLAAEKGLFDVTPGPAPELNLISLNVPSALVKDLMHNTSIDTPILPAVEHYLAVHTSLQLSRLTLVRVGIANVYIGAPTTTTLTLRAGQSSAEVRIKFTAVTSNGRRSGKRREAFESSPVEVKRIANVLHRLISLAALDEW